MKYYIHIPKLLEFALNVVCDNVTLRGKQCLITPIPYPLYLRCITTYADKYAKYRYSIFRFYQDIRRNAKSSIEIGRLYPNVLDHVVLDDDDVNSELIVEVAQSHLVHDAAASIQRFASRCLAADKSEMMVNVMSRALAHFMPFPKPIIDVLLFYGAKLDPNHENYFNRACLRGMIDIVQQTIQDDGLYQSSFNNHCVLAVMESGDCETIKLVDIRACDWDQLADMIDGTSLFNATVQFMELLVSLKILHRGTHYKFENIPSFSVLQWILDHDVMKHDDVLIDIAYNASRYSGHYFDMLRYLIEQRNFTVPRDMLLKFELSYATDLYVVDYLLLHGAYVNAVCRYGKTGLECTSLFIRYWIDNGFIVQSDDAAAMRSCIGQNLTAPVLEMVIDKYFLRVNADTYGNTALHAACRWDNYEVVEMLLARGADVNKQDYRRETPYSLTTDDRIKQLLISHGYVVTNK